MKRILILSFTFITFLNLKAQTYNSYYAGIVENTIAINVLNDLTTFESFGMKRLGTTALANTQNWITDRYQSLGYTDVIFQPFTFNGKTTNNRLQKKIYVWQRLIRIQIMRSLSSQLSINHVSKASSNSATALPV